MGNGDSMNIFVHVWTARFEGAKENPSDSILSPEEKARLGQMTAEKRRKEFVQGRFGLRQLSSIYLGISPESVKITLDENGKPSLGHGPSSPGISLSHSDGRIVYALSSVPVGVDIERRRPVDVNRLASGHFSAHERVALEKLTDERARLEFFFDHWTRKEAVSKLLGLGLRAPFEKIQISGDHAQFEKESISTRAFDWDDYRMAVAYQTGTNVDVAWRGSVLP